MQQTSLPKVHFFLNGFFAERFVYAWNKIIISKCLLVTILAVYIDSDVQSLVDNK